MTLGSGRLAGTSTSRWIWLTGAIAGWMVRFFTTWTSTTNQAECRGTAIEVGLGGDLEVAMGKTLDRPAAHKGKAES